MKLSLCRRVRRWWHMRLRRLTPEAAEDLMDGIDLGDRAIHLPPVRLRGHLTRPGQNPPACPGLPTLERLEEIRREEHPSSGNVRP